MPVRLYRLQASVRLPFCFTLASVRARCSERIREVLVSTAFPHLLRLHRGVLLRLSGAGLHLQSYSTRVARDPLTLRLPLWMSITSLRHVSLGQITLLHQVATSICSCTTLGPHMNQTVRAMRHRITTLTTLVILTLLLFLAPPHPTPAVHIRPGLRRINGITQARGCLWGRVSLRPTLAPLVPTGEK